MQIFNLKYVQILSIIIILLFMNFVNILCLKYEEEDNYEDSNAETGNNEMYEGHLEPVTIGSSVKLQHSTTDYLLHSHDINWGSGSGQQSITAYHSFGDANSLWQIYTSSENHTKTYQHAAPIKCNDIIRLFHVTTRKWLHSHNGHRSPISQKQEVTGYGRDISHSDSGDNWKVICTHKNKLLNDYWRRGENILLQHVNTQYYLFSSKKYAFTDENCRNCPIIGQYEVSCNEKKVKGSMWKSSHGFYFRPFDFDENSEKYERVDIKNNNNDKRKTDL